MARPRKLGSLRVNTGATQPGGPWRNNDKQTFILPPRKAIEAVPGVAIDPGYRSPYAAPLFALSTQAERIFLKFGGARRLLTSLKAIGRPRNAATLYKWTYPRSKGGTGGLVPTSAWEDLLAAARAEGILITAEDMDPTFFVGLKQGPKP